jgi:flagella basal body P-ring formation protein FlgA
MLRLLLCALTGLLAAPVLSQPGQAQELKKAAVHTAATETIDDHYPGRTGNLKVRVRRVRGNLDTTETLRLQFSEWEGSPTGLAQANVRTRRPDGEWESAGWALLEVARFDSVATIRSRVQGDESIPASALETAWIETTDLRGEPVRIDTARSRARRGALVATRHLQSGRVLREHDVRRPHTVDAGSLIRVIYRQDQVVFRISCTAREAGVAEEVIRVHCAELKTTYRARIINENMAEWVETL